MDLLVHMSICHQARSRVSLEPSRPLSRACVCTPDLSSKTFLNPLQIAPLTVNKTSRHTLLCGKFYIQRKKKQPHFIKAPFIIIITIIITIIIIVIIIFIIVCVHTHTHIHNGTHRASQKIDFRSQLSSHTMDFGYQTQVNRLANPVLSSNDPSFWTLSF